MKTTRILFYFSLILLLVNSVIASENFEATFFNVGQGNCTLIKCPNGPPLLYDAGSTAFPSEGKTNLVLRIKQEIDTSINHWKFFKLNHPELEDTPDINVIISHGDKDHYILLSNILESLDNWHLLNINFVLGGETDEFLVDDTSRFGNARDCVTYFLQTTRSQAHYTSFPDKIFTFHSTNPLRRYFGDVSCQYLSAEPSSVNSNPSKAKNEKSVVVALTHNDRSLILMGDAEEEIERKIIANLLELRPTALLAGHHGAEAATCNDFVQRIQPEVYIISAKGSKHGHPRLLPISHMTRSARVVGIPIHLTFYESINLSYKVVTNLAIFNTENQGDIHLRLDDTLQWNNNSAVAIDNYVMYAKPGEKFMDFTGPECKDFWAHEFTALTSGFDKSIKLSFKLKYIRSPEPRAISPDEFRNLFGMDYYEFLADLNARNRAGG